MIEVCGTKLLEGDCSALLQSLPNESVHCCVTSPPYWGLRDYKVNGQLGREATPEAYVEKMVAVFREVRRVLRKDGTCWLNLGDSYGTGTTAAQKQSSNPGVGGNNPEAQNSVGRCGGMAKQLIGIPWRVAFALQADGWYLRQDIIWSKPNPMPESVRDRCTKAHEYVFMFSKSSRYYYDFESVVEPVASSSIERLRQSNLPNQKGSYRVPGKTNGPMKAVRRTSWKGAPSTRGKTAEHQLGRVQSEESRLKQDGTGKNTYTGFNARYDDALSRETRNRRSVWTITTKPFKGAHFATFPPDLIEPCILAGCPPGGTVLDPFGGAGTTGLVANRLGRYAVLSELNPEYVAMAAQRIEQDDAARLGSLFL